MVVVGDESDGGEDFWEEHQVMKPILHGSLAQLGKRVGSGEPWMGREEPHW